VIEALRVTSVDHAVTSLPFTHVYGLSVVNSHLGAGARISLEKRSVADTAFWTGRAKSPWSSLAGVTVTYELMRQKRVDTETLGGVRKLLHSGSKMPPDVFSWLHPTISADKTKIYLMYGQTEACGRISVLEPALLPDLASSVGSPVAGGRVSISSDQEIIYSGPNVMMGYACGREDLDGGDQMLGTLPTGDQGYLDANGKLFVTGRAGRTCKVFGQRICLDDIEDFFRDVSPAAAVSRDDCILLFCEAAELELRGKLVSLAKMFQVPPQTFVLRRIQSLPRTESGKICYRDLGEPREGS
jgi:acyl-coenzyme A synthetase/AMP-(fatty) acid ligase